MYGSVTFKHLIKIIIPIGWADQGIQHVDDEQASMAVDDSKAWWSFNIVANYVYSRWTAHTDVQNAIVNAEGKYSKRRSEQM